MGCLPKVLDICTRWALKVPKVIVQWRILPTNEVISNCFLTRRVALLFDCQGPGSGGRERLGRVVHFSALQLACYQVGGPSSPLQPLPLAFPAPISSTYPPNPGGPIGQIVVGDGAAGTCSSGALDPRWVGRYVEWDSVSVVTGL